MPLDPRDGDGDGFITGPDGKDDVPSSGGTVLAKKPNSGNLQERLAELRDRAAKSEMSEAEAESFREDAEQLRRDVAASANTGEVNPATDKDVNDQGLALTDGEVSDEAKAVISEYQSGSNVEINEFLRGEIEDSDGSLQASVSQLDKALAESKTLRDATVYRGQLLTEDQVSQLQGLGSSGGVYRDPAFLSTSISRTVGEDFIQSSKSQVGALFEIDVPAGSHAAYVDKYSGLFSSDPSNPIGAEFEMLLPRRQGLQVVSVTKQQSSGDRRVVVKLRLSA